MFVPNFKILSQVVSEKSLTEKKFTDRQTDRQTNIRTEKAKTIYPLYTSYTGGIIKRSGSAIVRIVEVAKCSQSPCVETSCLTIAAKKRILTIQLTVNLLMGRDT